MTNPSSILPTRVMVLGASPNPERYAYTATRMLLAHGYEVFPLGIKSGLIDGVSILTGHPLLANIHTVSLYLSPSHQAEVVDYLLQLRPKRVIFNPGTENPRLEQQLTQAGIITEQACTLVLLSTGTFLHMPAEETTLRDPR